MPGVAAISVHRPLVAEVEYGRFDDMQHQFVVRATSTVPGILRVHCLNRGPEGFWVAVITDPGTTGVDATWCGMWAKQSASWRRCCADLVFRCFYKNQPTIHKLYSRSGPVLAGVR